MEKSKLIKMFEEFLDSVSGGTNKPDSGLPLVKSLDEDLMQSVEVIYEPFKLDAHNQWMSDTTVASMAKQLWEGYKSGKVNLNLFHMEDIGPDQVELTKVEILSEDSQYGEHIVPKGTAIAYLQYHDKALWKLRKELTIGGLSVGGWMTINKPEGDDQ